MFLATVLTLPAINTEQYPSPVCDCFSMTNQRTLQHIVQLFNQTELVINSQLGVHCSPHHSLLLPSLMSREVELIYIREKSAGMTRLHSFLWALSTQLGASIPPSQLPLPLPLAPGVRAKAMFLLLELQWDKPCHNTSELCYVPRNHVTHTGKLVQGKYQAGRKLGQKYSSFFPGQSRNQVTLALGPSSLEVNCKCTDFGFWKPSSYTQREIERRKVYSCLYSPVLRLR